ncbi:hypothetical protein C8R44DRAFT_808926 [Mycena epipterygia]|nr:hypothetical protein C8R44DRAFT_808926 [Mycena epipterygia]
MNLDSPEAFLGILTNFPVLAHLKCCIKVTDIVAEGSRPMFPHLLSLALRGWYAQDALNLVTLPNLRALDLLNFIPREDISSFVSRSSCAIHHLAFAIYKDIDEEELTDWFQLFPTLESLEIRNCYDLAPLIDCLDKPCIFPDLKDITIRSVRAQVRPPLDYDALLDMLRSRKKLRSFVLDIQDLTSEWDSIRDSMRQYSGFPGRLVAAELKDFGLNFLVTVHGQSTRFARSSDPSRVWEPPHPFP